MKLRDGYLVVGHVRGVPIRVHWSMPLGALVLGGMSPAFWLAFFVIVLLHEGGHALLVRHYRHRVVSVDVTGLGGLCRWQGRATARERAVIAWGGVAAQAALLLVTGALVLVFGYPASGPLHTLASAFIRTNAFIILLNLVPIPPLDGAEAWTLVTRPWRDHAA